MEGLSPEGRFQLAYDGALGLATIAVLASGYRVKTRTGHHQLTLEAAGHALGKTASPVITYLDFCRRQRNAISYDGDEIGAPEADELLQEAARFATIIDEWLEQNRPDLI